MMDSYTDSVLETARKSGIVAERGGGRKTGRGLYRVVDVVDFLSDTLLGLLCFQLGPSQGNHLGLLLQLGNQLGLPRQLILLQLNQTGLTLGNLPRLPLQLGKHIGLRLRKRLAAQLCAQLHVPLGPQLGDQRGLLVQLGLRLRDQMGLPAGNQSDVLLGLPDGVTQALWGRSGWGFMLVSQRVVCRGRRAAAFVCRRREGTDNGEAESENHG